MQRQPRHDGGDQQVRPARAGAEDAPHRQHHRKIYTTLKIRFGDSRYHFGKRLLEAIRASQRRSGDAVFEACARAVADLLIGADGGNSAVRALYWPDTQPLYAGYLAWRGLVPEPAQRLGRNSAADFAC